MERRREDIDIYRLKRREIPRQTVLDNKVALVIVDLRSHGERDVGDNRTLLRIVLVLKQRFQRVHG